MEIDSNLFLLNLIALHKNIEKSMFQAQFQKSSVFKCRIQRILASFSERTFSIKFKGYPFAKLKLISRASLREGI